MLRSSYIHACVSAAAPACVCRQVATPEVYATENRATGHALVNAVARVGAFCSSYWVDSSNDTVKVGILLGVMNVIAGFFALMLPETKGTKIG